MARIDLDLSSFPYAPPATGSGAIAAMLPEDELETPPLPREHPKWVRDASAISQRARALLARMKPVVVRVLTFWDHRSHSIAIGLRRLGVDSSGSYRLE